MVLLRSGHRILKLQSSLTCPQTTFPAHLNRITYFPRSSTTLNGVRQLHSTTSGAPPSAFEYKAAVAFSGKSNVFDKKKHYYLFDAETGLGAYGEAELAKRGRKIPSGQDSFFIGPVGDYENRSVAFAVADGVGGYKDSGIDSADFAHGICRYMKESAAAHEDTAHAPMKPLAVLQAGYDKLCRDKSIQGGGSTACVAVADASGSLDVAKSVSTQHSVHCKTALTLHSLGDSGFIHLRMNAVNYYSDPQTHAFNTPFQLSAVPPKILAQIKNFGGSVPFCDMPGDASMSSHKLRHGDVVVFATDGVWDNLTAEEVLDIVSTSMVHNGAWTAPEGNGVQVSKALPWLTSENVSRESGGTKTPLQVQLAADIAKKAKDAGANSKRDGPFAKAVQQAFPQERWHGGKIDDVCVLVVIALDHNVA